MREPRTVLLVDDDPDVLFGVSARLRAAGYETIVASDGKAGLEKAVASRPDAIVLGVRMPVMDGLETFDELQKRSDTKHIPIVMLSANVKAQQDALDAGARFFIPKPFEGKHLVAAVDSAVLESCHETNKANPDE